MACMENFAPIEGIRVEVREGLLAVISGLPLKTLSSAVFNGGLREATIILNCQVQRDYDHADPKGYLENIAYQAGYSPESVIGLMTGVDVHNLAKDTRYQQGLTVCAIVTAGVSNATNAVNPSTIPLLNPGTINIILLIDGNLTEACMVNAIMMVTEAKSVALGDLDIRSQFSFEPASGTSTDAVVVACTGRGNSIEYAGSATSLGKMIGVSIRETVKAAISKSSGISPSRPLLRRLNERGIILDDLVQAALELYIPHPGVETREQATERLRKGFQNALQDTNLAALVLSGLRLEEDGGRGLIPGLSEENYNKDPSFLVADEIMGMAIADYIAGTRGVFEFVRFDKLKPGILKRLDPILDDVIGGIIAGVSSKMYTEALEHVHA